MYCSLDAPIAIPHCDDGNLCDENAECIDTDAGFFCVCDNGYDGDGFNCSKFSESGDIIDLGKW